MGIKQDRRARFREILARPQVTRAASVYDAVSARMAADAGFEVGIFAGSVASQAILGAPDITIITLSELAEQVRRISRASTIPFWVDADHGYGNALSVVRTIEELEDAGAAAASIEDTALPTRFGGTGRELISIEEFRGKLHAAVAAKQDPSFVVIGRTSAFATDPDEGLRRIEVCVEAGVDCLHIAGGGTLENLARIAEVTDLPIVDSLLPEDEAEAARLNVRLAGWNHVTFSQVVRTLRDSYEHLLARRPVEDLQPPPSAALLQTALAGDAYAEATERYLR